jgi:Ni,Fe-hydrogenase III component G
MINNMDTENNIQRKLIAKFNYLDGKIKIPRVRRISAEVSQDKFFEVFDFLVKDLQFTHLCAITGLDEGQFLSFIYHITTENGIVINLKISVPKENPVIKTVMPYFPCAEVYERELIDLLGAVVDSLPPGNRYPLPDTWPRDEFPLRKDWKPKAEAK